MLIQEGFNVFQGFYQYIIYPAFGKAQALGNFQVAEALLPAHLEHQLFLPGQAAQGLVYQLVIFAGAQLIFKAVICGSGNIGPNMVQQALVPGSFTNAVQRFVPGNYIAVMGGLFYKRQAFAVGPYLHKSILYNFLGIGPGFGKALYKSEDKRGVVIKENAERRFIPLRYALL